MLSKYKITSESAKDYTFLFTYDDGQELVHDHPVHIEAEEKEDFDIAVARYANAFREGKEKEEALEATTPTAIKSLLNKVQTLTVATKEAVAEGQ